MASSPSSKNARKPSSSGQGQRKRAASPAEKSGKRKPAASNAQQPLLDDGTKRNIVAIVCAIAALALILIVAWPTNAVVTSFLSLVLRRGLGIGAYILPILLIIVAGTFVARFESERMPARVIIGLMLVYFALLVILALYTPGAIAADGVTKAVSCNVTPTTCTISCSKQVICRGSRLMSRRTYL